jgi:hypothetical protein
MLAVLAFLVYANSFSNGFVGDDKEQLLQNPLVSGHRIAAAFGSGVWSFRGVQGNYYRPLQFLVYILLHGLFGFEAFGYHLFFVLMHALTTVLVYFLAWQLTTRSRIALAAAALFAVHPIHTEVVDWIASLPDMMLTAIAVAVVWWFARQGGSPRGGRIVGHCALYLAALMSKETGIMLLPLYLGYERICLGRPLRDLRKNAALYGALTATLAMYLVLRWSALGGLAPGQQTFHHLAPVEFGFSAIVTAAQYLGKLILPLDLNYFHIFQATRSVTPSFLISLAALAAVAVMAFRRGTPPAVTYGVLWIALTLAPALNLTGVGQNVFAERYLYLPSVGFAWIVGIGWEWWWARQSALAWTSGIAILLAGAWQTVARNPDWRDDFTLLQVTVAQSPQAGILHNNLAGVYVERNDLEHALSEERLAVQFEPHSAPFHKNLGLLLLSRDPAAATAELEEALRLQPSDGQVRGLVEQLRNRTAPPTAGSGIGRRQ